MVLYSLVEPFPSRGSKKTDLVIKALGRLWGRFWIGFWIILGSLWVHFGIILGPFRFLESQNVPKRMLKAHMKVSIPPHRSSFFTPLGRPQGPPKSIKIKLNRSKSANGLGS